MTTSGEKKDSSTTRTVTFQVTFSQDASSVSVNDNNSNLSKNDADFLENIELMHSSDWKVDDCKVVIGGDSNVNTTKNKDEKKSPTCSRFEKAFLLLTTFTVLANRLLSLVSDSAEKSYQYPPRGPPLSLEQALHSSYASRSVYSRKNNKKLPPSTSLVRIKQRHTAIYENYNAEWSHVPEVNAQSFYYDQKKQSHPFVRALIHKGWRQTDSKKDAHLLYSHSESAAWASSSLQPWQRFNYIPNKELWKNPYEFQYHYKEWGWQAQQQHDEKQQAGKLIYIAETGEQLASSVYIPETYLLSVPSSSNNSGDSSHGKQLVTKDISDFQNKISEARKEPTDKESTYWILKTENYDTLYQLAGQHEDKDALIALTNQSMARINNPGGGNDAKKQQRAFVQKYICDLLTWNQQKIEVRVFWAVVSLEPLIVLYHDGYINIVGGDNAKLDDYDYWDHAFDGKTNIVSRYAEGSAHHPGVNAKQSFAQFEKELEKLFPNLYKGGEHRYDEDYDDDDDEYNNRDNDESPYPFPAGSAINHIRSQIKEALADMIQVYQQTNAYSFPDGEKVTADNAFDIYCADFLVDQSLDVWLVSTPKSGCRYDDDNFFLLDMHASMFLGLVDVLEEVWKKQEKVDEKVMPLRHMGNWEVIYGDGVRFKYDGYDPSHRYEEKPSCPALSDVDDEESLIEEL